MNIILIGYRGTGKTAVGKALATRLGRLFYDSDTFLEEKLTTTISDMVAQQGWPYFRAREKEIIRELSALKDCVIATGGGAVMDQDNADCLAQNGFFVLLKADIATMIRRIQGDETSQQQRPDLLGGGIYEETRALINERMPTYERVADLAVDTTRLNIDEVVERIIKNGLKDLVLPE
jgi:shikimate kinase